MITGYIVILLLCLLFSAFFSATETAFSSLSRTRLQAMAHQGTSRAKLALRLSEDYDRLISTILIGNNIVNIAAASLGTVLFVRICGDAGATVSTVVLTVAVLIFGEITPKSIAKNDPEQFAMFAAAPIALLVRLFRPLCWLFSRWQKLVNRLVKLERSSRRSRTELMLLVDEVESDGSIDADTGELMRSALEFGAQTAEDVLTHRVELVAVPVESGKEEIAALFARSRYSRIPVYRDSIDNIVGFLHQKDFYDGSGISPLPLEKLLSPVLFVYKSERLRNLLLRMQKNRCHVAVVLDEYGGTYGIVTLEDILEELVGEIWDEHDGERADTSHD